MATNSSNLGYAEKSNIDSSDDLPDEYFSVIIEPLRTWGKSDWTEIWEHRELFYFLILRDLKIRYKQTLLGVAWVLLQPIVSTIVFSVIFGHLGQGRTMEIPYAAFAFSGFVLWIFFTSAISASSASLITSANLITKVYFPRLILPLATVAANLVDLFFGLLSLAVVMLIYGIVPGITILLAPILLILCVVTVSGLGIILAAINVRYRDVKYVLPVVLQLWLFVTPIFYSLEMIPEDSRWLWKLNPMTGIVNGFRAALFGGQFDLLEILVSLIFALFVGIVSVQIFYRMEDSFADVI